MSSALNGMGKQIGALRRMSPQQLRDRYAEVFSERTRSGNRQFLVKRIAWKLQANAEGSLSERAKRRARELAADSDLRLNPPPPETEDKASPDNAGTTPHNGNAHAAQRNGRDPRLPAPGTVLTRTYKDDTLQVTVLDSGFEFDGERFKSLSAIARAVTGSHVNGFQFFNLGGPA